MISIRNDWLVEELQRQGEAPFHRPMEVLEANWNASHVLETAVM